MKYVAPLFVGFVGMLISNAAFADAGQIDCKAPKKTVSVLQKRKPVQKRVHVQLPPVVAEDMCPASVVALKPEPTPGPAVLAEEVPNGAIGDGPTFSGIASSVPEESAAPIGHLVAHELTTGGVLPLPVYATNTVHDVQTIYVEVPANPPIGTPPVGLPPVGEIPPIGVPVSPVPEPETWALMAAGFLGLLMIKKRGVK